MTVYKHRHTPLNACHASDLPHHLKEYNLNARKSSVIAQSTKRSSIFSSIFSCSREILQAFKTFRKLLFNHSLLIDFRQVDILDFPYPTWKTSELLYIAFDSVGSVSRFETGTLYTQRQQQYVRENCCARSPVHLLFAAVLRVLSGWRLLVKERKPENLREPLRTAAHYGARATTLTYVLLWRCVCNVPVSNLDTLSVGRPGRKVSSK